MALGMMIITAFVPRKYTFENSIKRSYDEVVYYHMADNIQSGLENYHAQFIGEKLAEIKEGGKDDVPAYFFKPLFKHPPLYTLCVAASFKLFGTSKVNAFYVTLFFSIALIILSYFLGSLVHSRPVGLLSALLVTLDPISIICSQKIWMETLIAFLTTATIYVAIRAIKTQKHHLFIWSGIISGLGASTKYTGGIATLILLIYALFYNRKLFKDKYFLLGLLMPLIVLLPWIGWNISVYGPEYFGMQVDLHSDRGHALKLLRNLGLYAVAGAAILKIIKNLKDDLGDKKETIIGIRIFLSCAIAVLFYESILKSFNILHLPKGSWAGATFYGSTHKFYIQRLLEFSLIYFFAFLTFFIPQPKISQEERILRVGAIVVLLFFNIWTAFQSRYIISIIPLLIILGVKFLVDLHSKAQAIEALPTRILARSGILIFWVLILAKLFYVNEFMSYTNDFCYF